MYQGTVDGVGVELREPCLDDLPEIELICRERGQELSDMVKMSQTELMFNVFVVLCVKFGDKEKITREELGKLPMKAAKEVVEAVMFFRDSLSF